MLAVGHGPETVLGCVGDIPGRLGVAQCPSCAVVNLLKVRAAEDTVHPEIRIDVKRHGLGRDTQWIETAVRLVQSHLDLVQVRGDHADITILLAVYLLDTRERLVRMHGRQERIGGEPVKVGPLPGAAGPVLDAPGAVLVHIGVALPLGCLILHVILAVGVADNLRASLGLLRREGGELTLVEEVHLHHDVVEVVELGARDPVEVGMTQEVVLLGERGEVVAPGIAMALRIEGHRVVLVDKAVLVDVADVVVHGVGGFALALGEVPEHPVKDGAGHVVVLAAE